VTLAPQNVRDTEISLPISADLRAGVQGVQVLQPVLMGTPPLPHGGVESNIAAFVLRPIITSVSATRTQVEVNVSPPVGKSQQVVLFLNEYNPPADRPAHAYRFGAPSRDVLDAPDTSATITVPISGAVAGEYLLRVQVDGAESLLSVDANAASPTFNQYIAPRVTLP
jgi:hypothetical protein